MTDFSRLRLRKNRNQYLVAPRGYTADAPHRIAPVFDCPVHKLAGDFRLQALAQPGVAMEDISVDGRQLELIHRSPILRLSTRITCHFMPIGDAQSTMMIYSRTKYGSRFGNKKRIEAWLVAIEAPVERPRDEPVQPSASPDNA